MKINNRHASSLLILSVVLIFFIVPFLRRRYINSEIESHKKYTTALIYKKTGSLKNGDRWHYKFYVEDTEYEDYWPTHLDNRVEIGDFFLVVFSSKDPQRSKILYDFKFKGDANWAKNKIWDTVPHEYLISGKY